MVLRVRYGKCGTELAYAGMGLMQGRRTSMLVWALCYYALSGTDLAYGCISLCTCYGMSGTDTGRSY
eukprot:826669-Rhodomonas_salina.2